MTRKQAIKEFKRKGMIIPESAVELAISDMEKIEKIEQIVNSRDGFYLYDNLPPFQQIREVLESEGW